MDIIGLGARQHPCSSINEFLHLWNNYKGDKFQKVRHCLWNGIYGIIGDTQSDRLDHTVRNTCLLGFVQSDTDNSNWIFLSGAHFVHILFDRTRMSCKNVTPPTTKRHEWTDATMVADASESRNSVQLPW